LIALVTAGSATCGLGSLVGCGLAVLVGVALGPDVDVAVGLGAQVAEGFAVEVRVGGSLLGVSAARGIAEAGDAPAAMYFSSSTAPSTNRVSCPIVLFTNVYPSGREAQELQPWDERPRFSGFSPQRLTAFYCQKVRSVVHLFLYEGTKPARRWRRLSVH
jgi:hypothetical protein